MPESVAAKRALPTEVGDRGTYVQQHSVTGSEQMWTNQPLAGRPGWQLGPGVDVLAAAGTLVVQNNNNIHAGTVRGPTTRPVRSCEHLALSHA